MSVIALVDCNNFYASCERVFKPDLENRPIVILSNNDGCIIARSNQAKALGIPMGAPFFKFKKICEEHRVAVFSSNYTLYGDLSQRVMMALEFFCADIEVYSIDEAFLFLEKIPQINLIEYLISVRKLIKKWLGIPVSIGLAPTKTLAKLANLQAKKSSDVGVFDLREAALRDTLLATIPIQDVWGIGRALTDKLNKLNIYTAKELRDSDAKIMRKFFGVTLERTILELQGIACLDLAEIKPKQSIISSRSFGRKIVDLHQLEEAVSNYVARACEKLRADKSRAQCLQVFIHTSLHSEKKYYREIILTLAVPSADTSIFISLAKNGLKKIFKTGYEYSKAGVVLLGIVSESVRQQDLFAADNNNERKNKLMKLMDELNHNKIKPSLFIAAQGCNSSWKMKSDKKSPCYTSQWRQLIKIDTSIP